MNKILIATIAGLLSASPAIAQPIPHFRDWNSGSFWRGAPESPRERIEFLQQRVDRGIADGSLDRREGERVNGELNGVREWIHRLHVRDDGRLTDDQRARVQARLDEISQQIRWLRHNGW